MLLCYYSVWVLLLLLCWPRRYHSRCWQFTMPPSSKLPRWYSSIQGCFVEEPETSRRCCCDVACWSRLEPDIPWRTCSTYKSRGNTTQKHLPAYGTLSHVSASPRQRATHHTSTTSTAVQVHSLVAVAVLLFILVFQLKVAHLSRHHSCWLLLPV